MKNASISPNLRAANELLTRAQLQLDAAIEADRAGEPSTKALDGAAGSLKAARLSIDALSRQVAAEDTEAAPDLRACPGCGKSVRLLATRCGYCWKEL